MQMKCLHPLASPFLGHGVLTLNDKSTDKLRGMALPMLVELINALGSGVTASISEDNHLVLDADRPFTVGGNQDVLDTIGIAAGLYEWAAE